MNRLFELYVEKVDEKEKQTNEERLSFVSYVKLNGNGGIDVIYKNREMLEIAYLLVLY